MTPRFVSFLWEPTTYAGAKPRQSPIPRRREAELRRKAGAAGAFAQFDSGKACQ